MRRFPAFAIVLFGILASGVPAAGEQARPEAAVSLRLEMLLRLCDFETADDIKAWDFGAGTPKLTAQGATHGDKALEITFDPKGPYHPAYMSWRRVREGGSNRPGAPGRLEASDWSAFDALVLEVFNPGEQPVPGYVLIADQAWADKGRTYWNRHNAATTFAPGRTRWVIPVGGLYRGEAGSRNNDIKRNIDADSIVRLDFGFGAKGSQGRVIIDDLRLIKAEPPKGVWAFDFGPADQSVMLGWTAVSQATGYEKARGHGWGPQGGRPWEGAARDTTFGPPLLRDFCQAGGYRFRLDVPAGRYRVTVLYENSGYWGGEQAMHRKRRILVDGREVWSETRADGPAHALHRFEDVEPVGADIWETYMKPELARPAVFDAEAGAEGLTLSFEADRVWGSKLAALAVHRSDDAEAARWLAGQLDALAEEFRSHAVCLDKPGLPVGDRQARGSKAASPRLPALETSSRLAPATADMEVLAWPVGIEDDVTPNSVGRGDDPQPGDLLRPGADAARVPDVSRLAVRGEMETFCLALRPLKDCGRCRVEFGWTDSPARLPSETCAVWYNTSRGFGCIAYRTMPHTLRPAKTVELPKDVTRELVVRVRVPADAPAGAYSGQLVVTDPKGKELLRARLALRVADVTLDRDTDFRMGFFGLMPPALVPAEQRWEILEQTLAMLRDYGMNMVAGGPSWRLTGWKDGQPVADFGEMDRFFALLAKYGFTGPLNGYGGARFLGLHDGYEKGKTGEKVQQESGLPYPQALRRAWAAVDLHARENRWPTIWYAMCDETRVRDVAERELAFMKLMAEISAAFPRTLRTSGSYSVAFASRPDDPNDLLYWHQRFFQALDISDLNRHDPTVLAEAERLGKEVHIYNQGRSRYSFGLYQWSEFQKGIRARTQWHLNILHGYQFFDLDGREPDTAMICYGRGRLYPTIHFERCREGAEDFYLYNTLWKLIQRRSKAGGKGPALQAAAALLKRATDPVQLNERQPPEGYDADALKAEIVSAIETIAKAE